MSQIRDIGELWSILSRPFLVLLDADASDFRHYKVKSG
jgi:hypothetical protein